MSQRVYLTARTSDAETELFEARNYLPFFWLALLDQSLLADCEKWWLEEEQLRLSEDENGYERFADIWPPLTTITLDQPALRRNAARTRVFLEIHFPKLLDFHREFTRYLLTQLSGEDDTILLEISALVAFTSAADYHAGLRAQVAALDEQHPWQWTAPGPALLDLTGYASAAVFTEAYPALQQLNRSQPERRTLTADPPLKADRLPSGQPTAEEKIDTTFGLLMLGLLAVISVAANSFWWNGQAYGFPLPFYKLPAAGPPQWHLGALALDVPLVAFLAWHLRGLGRAVWELVQHWRRR